MLFLLSKAFAAWLLVLLTSSLALGIISSLLRVKVKRLILGVGSPTLAIGWLTVRPIPISSTLNVDAETLRSKGGTFAWKAYVLMCVPTVAAFALAFVFIGPAAWPTSASTIPQFFLGAFSPFDVAQSLLSSLEASEIEGTNSEFLGLIAAKASGIFVLFLLVNAIGRTIFRFQDVDPRNVQQLLALFYFGGVALAISWCLALFNFLVK